MPRAAPIAPPPIRCSVVIADAPPPTAFPVRGSAWRTRAIEGAAPAPHPGRRGRPRPSGADGSAVADPGPGERWTGGFRPMGNPPAPVPDGPQRRGQPTRNGTAMPVAAPGSADAGPADRALRSPDDGKPARQQRAGVCRGAGSRKPADALPTGPLRPSLADAVARERRRPERRGLAGPGGGGSPGPGGPGPVPAREKKGPLPGGRTGGATLGGQRTMVRGAKALRNLTFRQRPWRERPPSTDCL